MNILLTGGTGLIGQALCKSLIDQGHKLTVLSRTPETVSHKCGSSVQALASLGEWQPDDHYHAVINLAGAPIVGRRWSEKRKRTLWDSRVKLTKALVERMSQVRTKPEVLISASAIGIYGNCGEDEVLEQNTAANDFGARLCSTWEDAAVEAEKHGIRTCRIRTGLVLSKEGGMLKQMLLPFKLALGSRIGNGQQWMSWIHIDDHIAIVGKLLSDPGCQGPFNLSAPNPVRNHDFTRSLAHAVNRPSFLVTPAWLIKSLLGESAELLLGGQKVLPSRITAAGYEFVYPELDSALVQLCSH